MQETQVKNMGGIIKLVTLFVQFALIVDYAFSVTWQYWASTTEVVSKISFSVMSFFRMISSAPLTFFGDITPPTIILDVLGEPTAESIINGDALMPEWIFVIFGVVAVTAIIYFLELLKQLLVKISEEGVYSRSIEEKLTDLFRTYVVIQVVGYVAKLILFAFMYSQLLSRLSQSESMQMLQSQLSASIPWVALVVIGASFAALQLYKRTVALKEDNLLTI